MKKYLLMSAVALGLLVTSCGFSREATSNVNQIQTQVVLNQKNYKIVKNVSGESSQIYVLGIGGISNKALSESAMSEMIKNADLKESQAIINANVQFKSSFYLLFGQRKAIANGTVIEFTK